jgi:hypothetical protein
MYITYVCCTPQIGSKPTLPLRFSCWCYFAPTFLGLLEATGIFSHKLSPTESCCSTFDSEVLAAYPSARHFRFVLEGPQFALFTDHKPLVTALAKSGSPFSSRQQHHLSFHFEFSTTFFHLPGPQNVVADALSRPFSPPLPVTMVITAPISLFPLPLSYQDIAKAQQQCPCIPSLQVLPSPQITTIPLTPTLSLFGDMSIITFRPLVPPSFCKHLPPHPLLRTSQHPCLPSPHHFLLPLGWHSQGHQPLDKLPRHTQIFHLHPLPFLFLPIIFPTSM